jgi:hypothetical protein
MKIALCLHGMFDSPMDKTSNGLDGREYIQKHIMDKGDVDVFIHSWDLEKQGLIEAMYQPKAAIFEPQKDFSELTKEAWVYFQERLILAAGEFQHSMPIQRHSALYR